MNPLVLTLLVVLVAAALAAASYFVAGSAERPPRLAVAGRMVAWSALALLLLNIGCPGALQQEETLVLLDASPSLEAAGGQADSARALAASQGEVLEFTGSRLRQALETGLASGRPVVVVTDGEIVDAAGLPPSLLAGARVQVLPRSPQADRAIAGVDGPRHLAQGDTLTLTVDLRAVLDSFPAGLAVEAVAGGEVLARAEVPAGALGRSQVSLVSGPIALPPGQHLVEVRLANAPDADPRTDLRWHHLTVSATPGIVLVANPATWDSRFLYRTLASVAGLPIEGYLQLEPGSWRRMRDLRPVPTQAVLRAVQGADLLVSVGAEPPGAAGSRARGRWLWPAQAAADGDWYVEVEPGSPLAAAFGGVAADSLLPADGLVPGTPTAGSWTALSVRLGRRGAPQAAVYGSDGPGGRRVVVAATGLWRWAFQGGIQEQAYRGWVASTVTWLLGRSSAATDGAAVPLRPVVERDEPMVFQWVAGDSTAPVPVTFTSDTAVRLDTLRFDGAGRASVSLPEGNWRYALGTGGAGVVGVEGYSSEFIPGPQTLQPGEATRAPTRRERGSRELPWLFALAIVGWCVEWGARRRAGMR